MADRAAEVERDRAEAARRAARIGVDLPEPCVAGVAANLRLLEAHLRTLRGEQA